jgi:RecA-family ATPase
MIQEYVKQCPVKPLIVVDSLAAFNPGDENDVKAIRAFMKPVRKLASLGASILIIHHTGKADTAQEYRGSSAIKDSVDIAFRVHNSKPNKKLERLKIEVKKMRFLVTDGGEFYYNNGRFTSGNEATEDERLRKLLHEHPGITGSGFESKAKEAGISRKAARQFLKDGAPDKISVTDGPNHSKIYSLHRGPLLQLRIMPLSEIWDDPDPQPEAEELAS